MNLLASLPTVIGTAAVAPALLILWLVIAAGERPGPPAKVWTAIAEDVRALPENQGAIGKVLTAELKLKLFETASSKPEWLVAHCAAVLAVSTTCRGVEIKNLRWQDVDLFSRTASIHRSKTAAGHRTIPLNGDAMAALSRLLERARGLRSSEPEHYVFPTCEHLIIDPGRPQKSWRTAWRKLTSENTCRVTSPCWPQPATSLCESSGCTAAKAGVLALALICAFQRCAATAFMPTDP